MKKAEKIQPFLHLALCLLAFSIPIKFAFSSICLIILSVLWLFQADFSQVFKNVKKRKALWPWYIFYLLLLVSYTYSENQAQASFDLKSKLSYIILPLIVGSGINLDRKLLERFLVWLIAGVTVAAIISLTDAIILWQTENYFPALFYHTLVRKLDANAVYTAWYTIFALSLLYFMPWEFFFTKKKKGIRICLLLFLQVFFFLLSARMFILLFLLFIIPYIIKKSFANIQRGIIVSVMSIAIVVGGIYLINTTNNPIKDRFNNILNRDTEIAWLNDYSQVDVNHLDNVTLRLFLWRLGVESISEKNAWIAGVGNGDVHLALTEKMMEYKVPEINNPDENKRPGFHNANLHNMFLQSLVMIGIPGLIIMIIIAFTPLFYLNKVIPYQPFLLFNITSILFMMQEAVLQTQAGIFFYILIISMFWGLYYNNNQIKNKQL